MSELNCTQLLLMKGMTVISVQGLHSVGVLATTLSIHQCILSKKGKAWTLLTGVEPVSQDGGCEDSSSTLIGPQLHEARHLQVFCAVFPPFLPRTADTSIPILR